MAPAGKVVSSPIKAPAAPPVQEAPKSSSWNGRRVAQGVGGVLLVAAAIWTAPVTAPISALITIGLVCIGIIATVDALFSKKVQKKDAVLSAAPASKKLTDPKAKILINRQSSLSKDAKTIIRGKNWRKSLVREIDVSAKRGTPLIYERTTKSLYPSKYEKGIEFGGPGSKNYYNALKQQLKADGLSEQMALRVMATSTQWGETAAIFQWQNQWEKQFNPDDNSEILFMGISDKQALNSTVTIKIVKTGDQTKVIVSKSLRVILTTGPGGNLREADLSYNYTLNENRKKDRLRITETQLYHPQSRKPL